MTKSIFPLPDDWRDAVLVGRIDLGEGGVDFPAIVAYLKSINWRGHLNVELDTSPWRPPKESARITANYIRNTLKIEL